MANRILFVQLDQKDNPIAVMELQDGRWEFADLNEYWNVEHDLVFGPSSDGYGTGQEWSSELYAFHADSMSDPLDPPSAEEAESVRNLFALHLTQNGDIEDEDEIDVAFCYRVTNE